MKPILTFAMVIATFFSLQAQSVHVMLVTGGHAYDTLQFFQLFDSFDHLEYTHFTQPHANAALTEGAAEAYDVLVFYDMWQPVSQEEKAAYLDLTRKGKPMLFLHHSLVSYQEWPEFEKIIGGRYIENSKMPKKEQSTFKHDVWVNVNIAGAAHPVTAGVTSFLLFDEVYGNYRVLPEIKPLLTTTHPESTPIIGWENRYRASTIIYLQPGHDKHAFESAAYRKLILNSIRYLARQQ